MRGKIGNFGCFFVSVYISKGLFVMPCKIVQKKKARNDSLGGCPFVDVDAYFGAFQLPMILQVQSFWFAFSLRPNYFS